MTGLPPELVSAVLASPEDDAPRLACADWLEEHGDPDAAAFVRAQVRLARRAGLRLSTREVSRLAAQERDLLARNESRWVAAGGPAVAEWSRGFVVGLTLRDPAPDAVARLAAFPLLERLTLEAARPLPAAVLDALPHLPRLESLSATVDLPALREADIARLAGLPRFGRHGMPMLESEPQLRLVGPGGARTLNWAERQAIGARVAARLAGAPVAELPALLRPHAAGCVVGPGGRVRLELPGLSGPDADAVLARVPGLAGVLLDGPRVPAWLAAHPDLRHLAFNDLEEFDPEPLRGMRRLHSFRCSWPRLSEAGEAALAEWLAGLPELRTVSLDRGVAGRATLARLAGLASLRVLSVPEGAEGPAGPAGLVETDAAPRLRAGRPPTRLRAVGGDGGPSDARLLAAGVWFRRENGGGRELRPLPLGEPERVGDGVTLRVPDWMARVPPPPARDDATPLAAWCEWGDGDPVDRLGECGPAWLVLERVPFRVRAADAGRHLAAPPDESGQPVLWSRPRVEAVARRHTVVTGTDHFAAPPSHYRALWAGRHASLRLRAEWTDFRILPFHEIIPAVCRTLTWDEP